MDGKSAPEKESNNNRSFDFYYDKQHIDSRFRNFSSQIELINNRNWDYIKLITIFILSITLFFYWIILPHHVDESKLYVRKEIQNLKEQLEKQLLKQKNYFERYIHIFADIFINSVHPDQTGDLKFDFKRCRALYPIPTNVLDVGNMCDHIESIFRHNMTRCNKPDLSSFEWICAPNDYCKFDQYSFFFLKGQNILINSTYGSQCRRNGGCSVSPLFKDQCERVNQKTLDPVKQVVDKICPTEPIQPIPYSDNGKVSPSTDIPCEKPQENDENINWCEFLTKPAGDEKRIYKKAEWYTYDGNNHARRCVETFLREDFFIVGKKLFWKDEIMHKCCLQSGKSDCDSYLVQVPDICKK